MRKRSGIFAIVWLAIWTLGGFIGLTQLWLLPEGAPFLQIVVLLGLVILCVCAFAMTIFRMLRFAGTAQREDAK